MDYKNFNSMFAIISGLGHGSVSRLAHTWDRLPNKWKKLFMVSAIWFFLLEAPVVFSPQLALVHNVYRLSHLRLL